MIDHPKRPLVAHGLPGAAAHPHDIAHLVAEVFDAAPMEVRGRLIEQLLRPLGVLSLVVVADGIFAKLRFRGGWQDFHARLEDVQSVRADHVIALVDHVQQVSVEAVDGLVQLLSASPVMAGSAAAALLMARLLQRAGARAGSTASATHDPRAGPPALP